MALTGLTEEELLEWLSTSDGLSEWLVLLSSPDPFFCMAWHGLPAGAEDTGRLIEAYQELKQ